MKKIKASQLIYSISTEVDTEIEITAVRVNRLCSNMRLKDIYCELRQIDFEDLMMEFPNVISMDELEKAINTVHSGGAMINPEVATKVVDFFSEMAQSNYDTSIHAQNVEEITDAEWEIIKLVGRGMSNKEISTELSLSEGTVRNYLSTILSKLDLRDRTQLAIWEVQIDETETRKMVETNHCCWIGHKFIICWFCDLSQTTKNCFNFWNVRRKQVGCSR